MECLSGIATATRTHLRAGKGISLRILKFRVNDFLSLKETKDVSLEPDITLLLGKNENGKTNTLLALEAFDREWTYEMEELCRYSSTRQQLASGTATPADFLIATLWFALDDGDRESLSQVDSSLGKAQVIKVSKHFDNRYAVEVDDEPVVDAESSPPSAVPAVLDWVIGFSSRLNEHASRHPPFSESIPSIQKGVRQLQKLVEQGQYDEAFEVLLSRIADVPNTDEAIQQDIAEARSHLESLRSSVAAEVQASEATATKRILDILPRFVYFDDVELLEDRVKISEFLADRTNYKTLANLVELTGLDVARLPNDDAFARSEATQRASTQITGLVNSSWTQEKVQVTVDADGEDLFVVVQDEKGGYDPPSKRSRGFQWYLGFYINFNAGSRGELRNTVLLLDDPGVHLHPSGQRDLLRTIERLSETNQVVISTHSPFLIDRRHLNRIRIVEKGSGTSGTAIIEKWHDSANDAFEPIRAALGMSIGDSLVMGKRNVVVEGPSDLFILTGICSAFSRLGLDSLDLGEVSIFPVDGAPKVPYWSAIIYKERLPVVALLDHDSEGRKAAKLITETLGLPERAILTLEGLGANEACTDVELEDLINAELYHRAFAEAYRDLLKAKRVDLPGLEDLPVTDCSRVKPYQDFLKGHRMGGFDKTVVARAFQLVCTEPALQKETLGEHMVWAFSSLFERLRERLA